MIRAYKENGKTWVSLVDIVWLIINDYKGEWYLIPWNRDIHNVAEK